MTRLLLALALAVSPVPALAQSQVPAGQEIVIADQRIAGVADPRAFVAATYARYQASPNAPPADQAYAYSPRLKGLFDAYEAWTRLHEDLVGALDFDWWTNAQDFRISHVVLRDLNEGPDLRWIIARFDNLDRHEEIRFRFVRDGGRWYLDDAMQGTGGGEHGWTLSALLQSREQ
jgi:hypothetical protein